ncbi:MAG: tryptophan synthase subunit alpha [Chloroflexi bacterium]|nr:tryptophan synthase subunit alpha [Chloroflexota bacterium]
MNLIDKTFARLKTMRRAALMPYVPLGYPTPEISRALIHTLSDAGADMIELGIPFSDPLADGPVIQRATEIALQNGMTVKKCLEIARAAREDGVACPLILMGYYNPILRFGLAEFADAAQSAGADGFIVPDLPPEEANDFAAACSARNLDLIFLAAPTSTDARLKKIGAATRGFLYLVSVTGVTGARDSIASDLNAFVARARATTEKPICVGFGIANAETARAVAQIADGVIVGSALVSRIADSENAVDETRKFISELRAAIEN